MNLPDHCIVPHLTTAQTGPIQAIEQHLLDHTIAIETWFRAQWHLTPPPLNCSVDLRNAGFKLAPVDTNLFPAGFNNLNPDFMPLCVQAAQATLHHIYPGVKRILIVPENHTRNLFYLENLFALQNILSKAGFEVRIGSLLEEITEPTTIELPSGHSVCLEPLKRDDNRIGLDDFSPCLIVLNNDLSGGYPDLLRDIEQPIRPPLSLGWSTRLKSRHFAHYEAVTEEFANVIEIDPWLITPLSRNCGEVDFMNHTGEACLVKNAELLFESMRKKYEEYGIKQDPFIVIKADAGTYGMGIMVIHSPDEITALNRKQRTRMSKSKGSQKISKVILQEGVYTFETLGPEEAVAEPVVYMIGQHIVGGFYRVHKGRKITENLNAPGMHFEPLAFAHCCNTPDEALAPDAHPNRFYAYGVIARLALLAAARELQEVLK